MDIFPRRLIVERPVAQKDQTKSSLELCNSFAINSQITRLKLKRENTNNNKRSLKKQEIFIFSPCRSPACYRRPNHFLPAAFSALETNNDKSVGLIYLPCAKNGQRYYSQTMKECVCIIFIER